MHPPSRVASARSAASWCGGTPAHQKHDRGQNSSCRPRLLSAFAPPPPHTWSGTRGAIVEGCLGNCQLSSLGMQPRPTASNLSLYVAFLGCHRQDHQNTSAYKPHIPIQMQTKAYPLKDNVVSRLTTPPPPRIRRGRPENSKPLRNRPI